MYFLEAVKAQVTYIFRWLLKHRSGHGKVVPTPHQQLQHLFHPTRNIPAVLSSSAPGGPILGVTLHHDAAEQVVHGWGHMHTSNKCFMDTAQAASGAFECEMYTY